MTIADPQNWVALFAFFAVAITAGQLSAKAKRRAEEAERLYRDWFAVYFETSDEESGKINPQTSEVLHENITFAETLGAKVIKLNSDNVADSLLKFACENEITHVIFGQSARSRWQICWKDSIINRFLKEVKDAAVHVIPIEKEFR